MYAYIETRLYWGEGVTASMLANVFKLARPNAHKVIAEYRSLYPYNMEYNASKKRHIARHNFIAHHISNQADDYLDYVRGMSAISHYWDDMDWNEVIFSDVDKQLKPQLDKQIIRIVLSAIQNEQTLMIRYQSKLQLMLREISPHHLVHASHRYHIRAYCHQYDMYLDFVLSRIEEAEISTTDWVSAAHDSAWRASISVYFKINPELPDKVKRSLQLDYALETDIRVINTQQAKLGYIRREMERIDWKYQCRLWIEVDIKKIQPIK